jgi:hypothetical protein
MKETYENMKILLDSIKYDQHNWLICGDLKAIAFLLGQEGGYTKYVSGIVVLLRFITNRRSGLSE